MKAILFILLLFPALCQAQPETFITAGAVATKGAYGGQVAASFNGGDLQPNLYGSVGLEILAAGKSRVYWPLTLDLRYMPSEWKVRPFVLGGIGYQLFPGAGFAQAGVGIHIKNIVQLTGSYRLGFGSFMQCEGWYVSIGKPFQL